MDIWEFLAPALESVLAGVATLVVSTLGLYLRNWLVARIGQEKLIMSGDIARAAVLAVEQQAKKYGWDGESKKAEAIQLVDAWLTQHGIDIDEARVLALIEAAVYEEFNHWLPQPAAE